MDGFIDRAVNTAAGVVIGVFVVVLVAWVFHDFIIGMLADIYYSWKRHFDGNKNS